VHSESPELVGRFATALPVSRLLVNSPAGLACIGVGNGLTPSFTLGCGTFGGTSTTDNVSYLPTRSQYIERIARPLTDQLAATPVSGTSPGTGAPFGATNIARSISLSAFSHQLLPDLGTLWAETEVSAPVPRIPKLHLAGRIDNILSIALRQAGSGKPLRGLNQAPTQRPVQLVGSAA
jgi:hypothetical protein